MPASNGGVGNKARKLNHDVNFLTLQLGGASSATPPPPSNPRQIRPPFSFTALLTAADDDIDDDLYNDELDDVKYDVDVETQQRIDRIISQHGEALRQEVTRAHNGSVQRAMEESPAVKKLKKKEEELQLQLAKKAELERKAAQHREEVDRLVARVRCMEQEILSLQSAIRRYAEAAQEDAESSSSEDPERPRYGCRLCKRRVATVMMWPCRHVCACKQCDDNTTVCPVCFGDKATSVEVRLPS